MGLFTKTATSPSGRHVADFPAVIEARRKYAKTQQDLAAVQSELARLRTPPLDLLDERGKAVADYLATGNLEAKRRDPVNIKIGELMQQEWVLREAMKEQADVLQAEEYKAAKAIGKEFFEPQFRKLMQTLIEQMLAALKTQRELNQLADLYEQEGGSRAEPLWSLRASPIEAMGTPTLPANNRLGYWAEEARRQGFEI